MIIVREMFIAKPGMASKMAKMFKDEWGPETRVMTDLTGVYNKVVVESEYASLADWETEMKKYMNQPKKESDSSKPKHTDMYTQGKREIFRIW